MKESNTIKILHLTIKYKYFKLIAEGRKSFEFREIKPHWNKRLLDKDGTFKNFNEIHIRNGYNVDKPFMRLKWKGIKIGEYKNKSCYAIDVSEIIEIINHN